MSETRLRKGNVLHEWIYLTGRRPFGVGTNPVLPFLPQGVNQQGIYSNAFERKSGCHNVFLGKFMK